MYMYTDLVNIIYYLPAGLVPGASPLCTLKSAHFCWKTKWGEISISYIQQTQEAGWRSWEEVWTAATNQEEWKSSVKALCATRHKEDR